LMRREGSLTSTIVQTLPSSPSPVTPSRPCLI
jgi:hypothetical protein